ncbi:MAG: hypothetical protein LBK60_05250 [Verrucomicrobiales bacterium]|jgi:hypothetical protein|nr:hypothetical protein [Verrucomicrobiales bacterium]
MAEISPPTVSLLLWRELLAVSLEFKRLAPWRFMADDMVAHVPDDGGQANFASVLGANGELCGLVLYRGERMIAEMNDIWADAESGLEPDAEFEFRQNALTLWFGPKDELVWHERKILLALHYKPRFDRANAWPKYLSHLPHYAPWDLDAGEVRLLTDALRRVNLFARQLEKNPGVYAEHGVGELPTLPADGEARELARLEWRDWAGAGREPPAVADGVWRGAGLEHIAGLPQEAGWCLETDFVYALVAAEGEGMSRPWQPRRLGVAESGGRMLSLTVLHPADGDDLSVSVARELAKVMVARGRRPAKVLLGREEWERSLAAGLARVGVPVEAPDNLPTIDNLLYQLPHLMLSVDKAHLPGKN